jgi:hydroxypyruvate isomerase
MLTFAPNISWLFPELSFRERPAEVARLGFTAIEFGFPSHADLHALQAARDELGMQIVLFNQDVPAWDRENRGYLVDPKRRGEFQRKLEESLEIARRLNVLKVMLPSGVEVPELARQAQRLCMLENLNWAAPLAAQAGVLFTLEVLNPVDNPGYFLTSGHEALEIVKALDHPNVRFQFDTYHLQMMEHSLVQILAEESRWIGHIQFADYPGRHEPGTGGIDFNLLMTKIQSSSYSGYIGLEYKPFAPGAAALDWVTKDLRR